MPNINSTMPSIDMLQPNTLKVTIFLS